MYSPAAFVVDDPERLVGFMRAHPFVTLAINGAAGPPLTAHLPVVVVCDAEGRPRELVGHVARANTFWREAQGALAVAVFTGPDAYVSPSWYPSRLTHGRVAPTWNYQRAEVRGTLAVEDDPARVRPYLDAITDTQEAGRDARWRVADAPKDYVDALSQHLIGLRLAVGSATAVFKLGQNQKAAEFTGAVAGLAACADPRDHAVAKAMTQARTPQ